MIDFCELDESTFFMDELSATRSALRTSSSKELSESPSADELLLTFFLRQDVFLDLGLDSGDASNTPSNVRELLLESSLTEFSEMISAITSATKVTILDRSGELESKALFVPFCFGFVGSFPLRSGTFGKPNFVLLAASLDLTSAEMVVLEALDGESSPFWRLCPGELAGELKGEVNGG